MQFYDFSQKHRNFRVGDEIFFLFADHSIFIDYFLQEIFELSHNGSHFVAEEVTRHETGPSVVMNSASYTNGKKTWLVAGQESHCQLYSVNTKVVSVENGEIPRRGSVPGGKEGLRQRRKSERESAKPEQGKENVEKVKADNFNFKSKKLQLVVKPVDSIQTDFG